MRYEHRMSFPVSSASIPATAAASASTDRVDRQVGPDVVRAIALLGVFAMNYHGYLNQPWGVTDPNWAERLFDPGRGILTTRFAATFVMVAGMGIVFFTNRSRLAGVKAAIVTDRWILRRRGLLLYGTGYVVDWIWSGTILFFYGAMFIVASFMFTWRRRWLIAFGLGSTLAAVGIQWWSLGRSLDGEFTDWLFISSPRSPRGLLFDTFVNGTHPLLPWLVFLCAGMVVARTDLASSYRKFVALAAGLGLLIVGYLASTIVSRLVGDELSDSAEKWRLFAATDPFSRGLLYVMTTLGSSIVAVVGISWVATRWSSSWPVRQIARAGRMTLTLYLAHVFVFNEVVNQRRWITPTGLDTALLFGLGVWVAMVVIAALWQMKWRLGPLEAIYRRFGGEHDRVLDASPAVLSAPTQRPQSPPSLLVPPAPPPR
jgi:uncharacterized protein